MPADLHVVLRQLVALADQHAAPAPGHLHHVVGHQPVPALDQVEHALALADPGAPDEQEPHAVDVRERAVQRGPCGERVLQHRLDAAVELRRLELGAHHGDLPSLRDLHQLRRDRQPLGHEDHREVEPEETFQRRLPGSRVERCQVGDFRLAQDVHPVRDEPRGEPRQRQAGARHLRVGEESVETQRAGQALELERLAVALDQVPESQGHTLSSSVGFRFRRRRVPGFSSWRRTLRLGLVERRAVVVAPAGGHHEVFAGGTEADFRRRHAGVHVEQEGDFGGSPDADFEAGGDFVRAFAQQVGQFTVAGGDCDGHASSREGVRSTAGEIPEVGLGQIGHAVPRQRFGKSAPRLAQAGHQGGVGGEFQHPGGQRRGVPVGNQEAGLAVPHRVPESRAVGREGGRPARGRFHNGNTPPLLRRREEIRAGAPQGAATCVLRTRTRETERLFPARARGSAPPTGARSSPVPAMSSDRSGRLRRAMSSARMARSTPL